MSKTKPVQNGRTPEAPDADAVAQLDKVRELLFGQQMREQHRVVERVETKVSSEVAELRAAMDRRLGTLEQDIRKELSGLTERLEAECAAREAGEREHGADVLRAREDAEAALAGLSARTDEGLGELRAGVLEHVGRLRHEMRDIHERLETALRETTARLGEAKPDRDMLADMLVEMASRVRGGEARGGDTREPKARRS